MAEEKAKRTRRPTIQKIEDDIRIAEEKITYHQGQVDKLKIKIENLKKRLDAEKNKTSDKDMIQWLRDNNITNMEQLQELIKK